MESRAATNNEMMDKWVMDNWVIPFGDVEVHGHWLAPIDGGPIAVIDNVLVTGESRPAILKKIKDFILVAIKTE